MKKKTLLFLLIPVGLILVFFLLNSFVKKEVEDELSRLAQPLVYDELSVNIFLNRFSLENVRTRQEEFELTAEEVLVKGISYYRFLFKDQLEVSSLQVEKPQVIYFPKDSTATDTTQKKEIRINSLLLKNGNFSRKDSDTSEIDLFVRFPEVEIEGINSAETNDIDSYRMQLDSVFLKMNAEHFINFGKTDAEDGRVNISDFRIVPFDSKAEFDRKVPYEKDRISLHISNVFMEKFSVEDVNDTLLLQNPEMIISEASLEIYRNKLLKEDVRRKALYSELLRKLPIKLNLEKIRVENSEILYEEQVQEGRQEAVIRFTDVTAEIDNLNNLDSEILPHPTISARANFMRGTPVDFTWTFPVFDPANSFAISGSFGALEGEALDPFIVPAMDLQMRGDINKINFDFTGNEENLRGVFTMDYDDLEVEIMSDEGENKRGFLSSIVNLFVNNEGDAEDPDENISAARDKQRSFWNYVWLGLRAGLMETMQQL